MLKYIWILALTLLSQTRPTDLREYVRAAMTEWIPPAAYQETEYRQIADAIATAAPNPEDAIQLAAIASFESRFAVKALGKKNEIGFLQIRPFFDRPVSCAPWSEHPTTKCTLVEQARIGLYRWKVLGRCSYTGETSTAPLCPLADHRYLRALDYLHAHPFIQPEGEVAAR